LSFPLRTGGGVAFALLLFAVVVVVGDSDFSAVTLFPPRGETGVALACLSALAETEVDVDVLAGDSLCGDGWVGCGLSVASLAVSVAST
jgi:hypothetical protein